jgi:uncharacterized metal-binding protein YceD (DUF177 family)
MTTPAVSPEFSRLLAADTIPTAGLTRIVTANPAECAALATRFNLPAIAALSCRFDLRRDRAGAIVATGDLAASLTQTCVISLDPFETTLRDRFQVRFVPAGDESDDPDPDTIDDVPFTAGGIDLGEAAAEQLALSLDPYPRQPGVTLDAATPTLPDDAPADAPENPFASLARLRRT